MQRVSFTGATNDVLSHVGLTSDSDGDCVSGRDQTGCVPVVVGLGNARGRRVHLSKRVGTLENHQRRAKDVYAQV